MLKINKKFRKANSHFFEESGIRANKSVYQHPFIVVSETKGNDRIPFPTSATKINLIYDIKEVLTLPYNTRILAQWKGKKRSDFYTFKVSEFKRYISEHPPTKGQKV